MFPESLLKDFTSYVERSIKLEGIYPAPCLSLDATGDGTCLAALAFGGSDGLKHSYKYFWEQIQFARCRAIIMGVDRTTLPGQGTEFADVLTCVLWYDDPDQNWWRTIQTAVINYQYEPRIVRSLDFNNEFWNKVLLDELRRTRPEFVIRIRKGEQEKEEVPETVNP